MGRISLIVAAVAMAAGLGACAKKEAAAPASSAPPATSSSKTTTTPQKGAAPAAKSTPPPADSKLAKVQAGMRPEDVVGVMGPPTHQRSYPTGKAWAPWYFGPDRWRTAFYYKGQGRVIFKGQGGLGGNSSVLHVEYDPTEPG